MKKLDRRYLELTKSELKKLFREATSFCKWDEYERGYKIRDKNAALGMDYFLNKTIDKRGKLVVNSKDNLIRVDYKKLRNAVREVIDESYLLYYNINGTFRKYNARIDERNKTADSLYLKFLGSLN